MKQKCFPGNLKIEIFYCTSQIFRKYNHQTGFLYNDGGLCLQNSLLVPLVWVLFAIGFVCFLVGGYVWYLVCVFVGWWLGLVFGWCVVYLGVRFGIGFVCLWVGKYVKMPFNSRDDVSVGLFY